MKKVILLPSFEAPYASLAEIAREIADTDTIITDNFGEVEKLAQAGMILKAVIVMGAGYQETILNPKEVLSRLQEIDPDMNISVVDGRDWGVPGQFFLPGESTPRIIKAALMA